MTVTEQIDRKHQEDLQRLRGFRLYYRLYWKSRI